MGLRAQVGGQGASGAFLTSLLCRVADKPDKQKAVNRVTQLGTPLLGGTVE